MRSPLTTTVALLWRLFGTPSSLGAIIIVVVVGIAVVVVIVVAAGILSAVSCRHTAGTTVVMVVR